MGKWGCSRRKVVNTFYFQSILLMLIKALFLRARRVLCLNFVLKLSLLQEFRGKYRQHGVKKELKNSRELECLCALLLSALALFSSRKRLPWQRKFQFTVYYVSVESLWDLPVRAQQEESEAEAGSRLWGAELLGSRAGAFQARKRSGQTGGSYLTLLLDGDAAGCYFVRLIGVTEGSCEERRHYAQESGSVFYCHLNTEGNTYHSAVFCVPC